MRALLRAARWASPALAPALVALSAGACAPSAAGRERVKLATAPLAPAREAEVMEWPGGGDAASTTEIQSPSTPLALPYREAAQHILDASLASSGAWQKLSYLTDLIGPRLSGSPELERAVAWARDAFAHERHENVALEPVRVPHWVRGAESADITAPISRRLHVLGLGGTVATPAGGVTAEVLVVRSFDDLENSKADAKGKIVLFNHVLPPGENPADAYDQALPYRIAGAMRAGPLGAVAVLVRSLATASLQTPHTGAMWYADPPAKKIPAAAISVEDAELISRLVERGQTPKVRLSLAARTLNDAESANVIAEIRGRERPEEIVLLGAHLDSWDVGQGAQDDGAGCVIVMQSLTTLRELGLLPRRTLRAVLFTNEENGLRGAKQYVEDHRAELERHAAAFEIDTGAGAPFGLSIDGDVSWNADLRDIVSLLSPINATTVVSGSSGSDVHALKASGVPLFGLLLDMSTYFDIHHSAADTLDKIDPVHLQKSVAALATLAFVVADREATWNRRLELQREPPSQRLVPP